MKIGASMTNVFFSKKIKTSFCFQYNRLSAVYLIIIYYFFFLFLDVCQIQNVAVVQVQHKMRTKTGKWIMNHFTFHLHKTAKNNQPKNHPCVCKIDLYRHKRQRNSNLKIKISVSRLYICLTSHSVFGVWVFYCIRIEKTSLTIWMVIFLYKYWMYFIHSFAFNSAFLRRSVSEEKQTKWIPS